MQESWRPTLELQSRIGGCRLSLGGRAFGDGATLQEAADQLLAKLLELALCFRASGITCSGELACDRDWLEFVWVIGEQAARGEDIREQIFGPA